MRRVVIAVILCLLALIAVPALAAPTTLTIVDVGLTACNGPLIEGHLSLLVYDEGGDLINGVDPVATTVHATHSNGPAPAVGWDFVAGESYQFAYSVGAAAATSVTISITADENGVSSGTVTVGCDGTVTFGGGSKGADARLNRHHCDLTSALYSTWRGIEVWDIQANSTGLYMGAYTDDDIAEYADSPPAENTLLAKALGQTTLEVLTTGELQIKIAPDAEGKSCTVIVDGIPVSSVYFLD